MKKTVKLSRKVVIFFNALLAVVLLNSCGNEQPILNGETPFVVHKVTEYNDTHASYYGAWNSDMGTRNNFIGSWRARIVLPKGYYTVGDTIVFEEPKHYR